MSELGEFESLRRYLFGIAYRMLGSVAEAEDIVQEAAISWSRMDEDGSLKKVRSKKTYFSTLVIRMCLGELRSAKNHRLEYVGEWLPESLPTDECAGAEELMELSDSLSMAFLILLENLSPVERAIFLLRETFDYSYSEIAEVVEKSEDNCRQLLHRAKKRLEGGRSIDSDSTEKHNELFSQFMLSCQSGNIESLIATLSEDIVLFSDGGGKAKAARNPIYGIEKVQRFLFGVMGKAPEDLQSIIQELNGETALVLFHGKQIYGTFQIHVVNGRIEEIYLLNNPDKLRHLEFLGDDS